MVVVPTATIAVTATVAHGVTTMYMASQGMEETNEYFRSKGKKQETDNLKGGKQGRNRDKSLKGEPKKFREYFHDRKQQEGWLHDVPMDVQKEWKKDWLDSGQPNTYKW